MNISALARSLNLSRQMVYKLAKQGMPVDSLEAAIDWRRRKLHPFQTKSGRFGGNSGVKQKVELMNETTRDTLITKSITHTLTEIIPNLWFGQIGWLGGALRDHGVIVTAEQLIKVQAMLFMVYMSEVDEFLKTEAENNFAFPKTLMARPGDGIHSTLMEQLNQILSREPKQLYEL